ncbi:hypothetical protein VNO80_25090 [Phaseolus coccineus]|uniref:Uncharacterized protein n=1 Tax=Phaseolus coccineus TaxID=3886 RepID=A0AAN9LTY9_PHACN
MGGVDRISSRFVKVVTVSFGKKHFPHRQLLLNKGETTKACRILEGGDMVICRRATERKDIHRPDNRHRDTRLSNIPTARLSSTAVPCRGLSSTLRSLIHSAFASA